MIRINGIAKEVSIQSEINLFEDDAKVFGKLNDVFNLTFVNIYKWLKTRNLKLTPNRCKSFIPTKASLAQLV